MAKIAVTGSKGGVGKTTTALMSALGLAARGRRVLLVDADRNAPLIRWAERSGEVRRVRVTAVSTGPDLSELLRVVRRSSFNERFDDVIVDTGADERWAPVCALWASLVLTPLTASPMDVFEALATADRVRRTAKIYGATPRVAGVLTRLSTVIRPRSLRLAAEQMRAAEVPLLATALFEKEAFRAVFAYGGDLDSLDETMSPGLGAARANRDAFVTELARVAGVPPEAAGEGSPPAWMTSVAVGGGEAVAA